MIITDKKYSYLNGNSYDEIKQRQIKKHDLDTKEDFEKFKKMLRISYNNYNEKSCSCKSNYYGCSIFSNRVDVSLVSYGEPSHCVFSGSSVGMQIVK
jgi:hypothetical protein